MSQFQIVKISKYRIRAGWRDWLILQVDLKNGLKGWSEFTESNGSIDTLYSALTEIEKTVHGVDFNDVMGLINALRRKYRQSLPGIMWKAISALENALWDLSSQMSEKTIFNLFMKSELNHRREFQSYWSHVPTTRIRAANHIQANPITNHFDLIKLGEEMRNLNFSAFKTNLISLSPYPKVHMPGFNKNFKISSEILPNNYCDEINKIIESITLKNKDLDIIIDLNYNLSSEQFIDFQRSLVGKRIRWIELDFDDWDLGEEYLKSAIFPICTGENILGLWNFMPILTNPRVQTISIDVIWNGLSESIKIANEAIKWGKKIAIHNYYGSLATSIGLTFLSLIPEDYLQLTEFDFDDVPWRDSIFTNPISLNNGYLVLEPGLGWNNSLNIEMAREYIELKRY